MYEINAPNHIKLKKNALVIDRFFADKKETVGILLFTEIKTHNSVEYTNRYQYIVYRVIEAIFCCIIRLRSHHLLR